MPENATMSMKRMSMATKSGKKKKNNNKKTFNKKKKARALPRNATMFMFMKRMPVAIRERDLYWVWFIRSLLDKDLLSLSDLYWIWINKDQ